MVCCQVMGNHTAVSIAGSQGNFELNVFKPVIIYNVLQSMQILADSLRTFDAHCARSIKPNLKRMHELKERSLMLVTALAPKLGYDTAAKVAKFAHEKGMTLKETVHKLGLMTEADFDKAVRPEKMV